MPESTPAISEAPQRRSRSLYLIAAAIGVMAVIVHLGSYWFSPSLTFFDVTLTCDEGLVSANVPLTRLTPEAKPRFAGLVYKRGELTWTAGAAGKTPLRSWMGMLDQ